MQEPFKNHVQVADDTPPPTPYGDCISRSLGWIVFIQLYGLVVKGCALNSEVSGSSLPGDTIYRRKDEEANSLISRYLDTVNPKL